MTARILGLALAALAGTAEAAVFECTYTQTCDDAGCGPYDATYRFELNPKNGMGQLVDVAGTFPGTYSLRGGLHHFLIVNDAGSELVTITPTGESSYAGHLGSDGGLITYRLAGQCVER